RYGIWWFNRRRNTVRQVTEGGPEGKRYRRQYKTTLRPREEWIAVPIPDAGVPRELVEAAREVLKENPRPSSAGDRFWELSGGVFVCGACGCRMLATRKKRSPDSDRCYHYYRCPTRRRVDRNACPQGKTSYRAEEIEQRVWRFISDLLKDPAQLRDDLDTMIELQRNGAHGDPEREAKAWLEKLAEVDRKRSGYIDLAADGIMDRDELHTKLAALEETRETAQRELEALHRHREEIEELERDRDGLLDSLEAVAPSRLEALAPEQRHHVYKMLRLKVVTYRDRTLEARWAFGACRFWTSHPQEEAAGNSLLWRDA
ncbi:MAG TPA: zinc ribbon domain-containing protein, partial [Rubrobacteraceae bacterium]|nr:zinc ribbon domain-containing protein [Rubrobacteraceae bacterium]